MFGKEPKLDNIMNHHKISGNISQILGNIKRYQRPSEMLGNIRHHHETSRTISKILGNNNQDLSEI